MSKKDFKIAVFDMDGVLVDTEMMYLHANQEFFKKIGVSIPIEEHRKFIGISATKMWTQIREKFNLTESVENLKKTEAELKYQTLIKTNLSPINGIISLLIQLKTQNKKIALASSSMKRNIELILEKAGLKNYFDFVISGEEVKKGKPDPDIFLAVAEYFHVSPYECIVFEDSTNGIKAAKSAGMYCYAYYNPNSGNQDLSLADEIVYSFDDYCKQLFI